MPELPEIAIVVITYNRYKEIRKTITALQKHIVYPEDKLHWVIADDSTGGDYLERMAKLKSHAGINHISTQKRSGWGANANNAMRFVANQYPKVDYIFQIEDDYVLNCELDLRAGVALLENRANVGMLRYRGSSGDHFIMHQFQADISNLHPDFKESSGGALGHVCYMQFDNKSPSLWIYSNGAHLKRYKSFHEHYGFYPENKQLGITEMNYAANVKEKMKEQNAPAIAILPQWVTMHFEHIGTSWQHSEHDIGT